MSALNLLTKHDDAIYNSCGIHPRITCLYRCPYAGNIYKSVDKEGKVTYSAIPPESSNDISKVDIQPPPSDERIDAAQQRHERNVNAAEIMDKNRTQRNEMIEEENRIKRERQKKLQKKTQQKEKSNDNTVYPYYRPYYRPRYPGMIIPPDKPVIDRPVHLPAKHP